MQLLPLLTFQAESAVGQGPDLTRYFAVLGGVAVVLLLLAFGLRRIISGSSLGFRNAKRSLQVVEILPLGSRRQLAVVRCYDRTFALGLGEKSVALVAELDAEVVQHDAAKAAVTRRSLIPRLRREQAESIQILHDETPSPVAQSRSAAPVSTLQNDGDVDPFVDLLERAQAQLDARRAAEKAQMAKAPNPAVGGLQELC